jgi:putative addiction module antidote
MKDTRIHADHATLWHGAFSTPNTGQNSTSLNSQNDMSPFHIFSAYVITIVRTQRRALFMLKLKVRKFGNSLGIVLPKEVINRLGTGDGGRLFLIEVPDGAYQLTPYDPEFEQKMAKAEDIISRYRDTLHALAK